MRHKKNTCKNKSHKGRKILLSQYDIKKYIDTQAVRKESKMIDGKNIKELF